MALTKKQTNKQKSWKETDTPPHLQRKVFYNSFKLQQTCVIYTSSRHGISFILSRVYVHQAKVIVWVYRIYHQMYQIYNRYSYRYAFLPSVLSLDYIQCPYCQRRFNQSAADRHIKFCQEQAARMPSKSKIGDPTKKPPVRTQVLCTNCTAQRMCIQTDDFVFFVFYFTWGDVSVKVHCIYCNIQHSFKLWIGCMLNRTFTHALQILVVWKKYLQNSEYFKLTHR